MVLNMVKFLQFEKVGALERKDSKSAFFLKILNITKG